MAVFQKTIQVRTQGNGHILDVTAQISRAVAESGLREGIVNVAGRGSTLGITTLEYEPGCVADLRNALEILAPADGEYAHNARWGDDNGYAHLRSALIGTSKGFPLARGQILLGTWQQIVLCDFDNRPRERQITVTVVGE